MPLRDDESKEPNAPQPGADQTQPTQPEGSAQTERDAQPGVSAQPAHAEGPVPSQGPAQPVPPRPGREGHRREVSQQASGASTGSASYAPPTGNPVGSGQPTGFSQPAGQPAGFGQPTGQPAGFTPPAPYPPYASYPPYAAAPQAPQKKSRAWIVALVAVVLVFVLIAMGMRACTAAFSSSMATDSSSQLDALTQDAVAVITLDGTIQYDGSSCSPEGLKELLDQAEGNDRIRAVVLRIDSGGGTATAGEEMAGYVRDFAKPIVVSSASTNASAAYEISSQADYIYTAQTTAIGAIGTAMQITDTSELMDMLGINIQDITSAGSKDSTYGTRPLTEEERAYYQNLVDQTNEVFIENVASGRGMDVEEVRTLATGLTFTGMDAVKNGLADEIGTKEDAEAKAAELAGISAYTVVDLDQQTDDLSAMLDLLAESDVPADATAGLLKELYEDGTLER